MPYSTRIPATLLVLLLLLSPGARAMEEAPAEAPPAADATTPAPAGDTDTTPTDTAPTETPPPAPEAPAEPGLDHEEAAARLQRRDELLSAGMETVAALEAVVDAARQDGSDAGFLWARAEFLLERARQFARLSGEAYDLLYLLEELLGNSDAEAPLAPLFRARAACLLGTLHRTAGDAEAARSAVAELGFLQDWIVCGPFENERGRSFETPFVSETAPPDLEATYPGKKRDITWRRIEGIHPLGEIDLAARFRPNREALAYALALVRVPETTEAVLRLGSSDSLAVWVNWREVYREQADRTAVPDQAAVTIRLRAGWNALLLKIGQSEDDWGFYARLTGPDGSPLAGLSVETDPERVGPLLVEIAPAEEGTGPLPDPALGAVSTLAERLERNPADHRACYYLGTIRLRRHQTGEGEHFAQQLLLRATRLAPERGEYYLALAEAAAATGEAIPDREQNLHRRVLEQARTLSGEEVAATLGLASYYFSSLRNLQKTETLLEAALAANPLSPRARNLQYDLFRARNWMAQAGALIEESLRRNPTHLETRIREGAFALERGQPLQALDAYQTARALDATDERAVRGEIAVLRASGRTDQALVRIAAYRSIAPTDPWGYLQGARLLRAEGRHEEALELVETLLAQAPEEHEALALRGELQFTLGRTEEAARSWRTALNLQPSNTALRRYLETKGLAMPRATRAVGDLAALAGAEAGREVPPGTSRVHILDEFVVELRADGTHAETTHLVIQPRTREAADELQRTPIHFNAETEELSVPVARVLRTDGRIAEADVQEVYPGRNGSPTFVVFPSLDPGDVIEIEYTVDQVRQSFFGSYYGTIHLMRRGVPVREVRHILLHPAGREVYVHTTGAVPAPVVVTDPDSGRVRKTWTMQDLPAIEIEPYMPPFPELSPTVQVSTFRDWDALSRWYWHLIREQNTSTPEIRARVRELTDGLETDLERVEALYDWVSQEIRNVPWEFGVYGYKPYNANSIFTRRFGDCKDKSTLLNVMAREIGLEAWPVLLYATDPTDLIAGRGREDLTLPMLKHFNHCISRIRIGERYVYVDPTLPRRSVENLPFTDAGAAGLVVTPEGAVRVTLPTHGPEDNLLEEESRLSLDEEGHIAMDQTLTGRGQVAVYLRARFADPATRARTLQFIARRAYGNCVVGAVRYAESPAVQPEELRDAAEMARLLVAAGPGEPEKAVAHIRSRIPEPDRARLEEMAAGGAVGFRENALVLNILNRLLEDPGLYDAGAFAEVELPDISALADGAEGAALPPRVLAHRNRLLLEAVFTSEIYPTLFTADYLDPDTVRMQWRVRLNEHASRSENALRVPLPRLLPQGPLDEGAAVPERLMVFAPYSVRRHDIALPLVFRQRREVSLNWPPGWRMANLLESFAVEAPFGRAQAAFSQLGTTLTVQSEVTVADDRIPLESYDLFRRLCVRADRLATTVFILEKE